MNSLLIAYDIVSDKRRKKIAELLEGYGVRVNMSVFEARLTSRDANEMIAKLQGLIKPKQDSARIYYLCDNCVIKSYALGANEPQPFCPLNGFI
jgi:CRISPR-associated protein Cas2